MSFPEGVPDPNSDFQMLDGGSGTSTGEPGVIIGSPLSSRHSVTIHVAASFILLATPLEKSCAAITPLPRASLTWGASAVCVETVDAMRRLSASERRKFSLMLLDWDCPGSSRRDGICMESVACGITGTTTASFRPELSRCVPRDASSEKASGGRPQSSTRPSAITAMPKREFMVLISNRSPGRLSHQPPVQSAGKGLYLDNTGPQELFLGEVYSPKHKPHLIPG